MAIVYPLTPPSSPGFSQVVLRRRVAGYPSVSPYNFSQYVQTFPGQAWEADLTLPRMKKDKIAAWRAFFAKLNGAAGTFLLGDPIFTSPRGSAAVTPGTPVVDGSGQTGNSLSLRGLPLSANGYLLEGDYIQLGSSGTSRLHMVLETVNTSGAGKATLTLWPSLRASPADGASVTLSNCKGVFRLVDSLTDDSATPGPFYTTSFKAMEALP